MAIFINKLFIFHFFIRKNREIADYHLKQRLERDLANREQKEKNIDFEKSLLGQLKQEYVLLRDYSIKR